MKNCEEYVVGKLIESEKRIEELQETIMRKNKALAEKEEEILRVKEDLEYLISKIEDKEKYFAMTLWKEFDKADFEKVSDIKSRVNGTIKF